MRKNLCFGLLSVLVGALSTQTGYGQLTSLTEGFDNSPSTLQSNGWVLINNSNPPSPVTTPPTGSVNFWAPGSVSTGIPAGQSGGVNSYIDVGFESGDASVSGAIVSNWLITPLLSLENGGSFSFYTQETPTNTSFANDLQVWVSPNGSGTNVGSTAAVPGGDFTVKAVEVNPTFSLTGYPTTWQQFTFTLSGLSGSTTGRIGFRYYLSDVFTQGTNIGIDTFSFADPTVFSRTVSGNWTDTTGWTPNGVPNGNTVTAQLVNFGSGANSVNLGGGTFTLNQLQFFGTGAGTWDVVNGTIVFDGTNPTFLNQGGSSGIVGLLPSLQLNANTTFNIVNVSAVTEVSGVISGVGQLIKTGSGTLMLTRTATYSGGTLISAGTLQIGNGVTNGSITGDVTDNGTLAFDQVGSVSFAGAISGTGTVEQIGSGILTLTGNNTYSGATTVSSGTLQAGSATAFSANSAFNVMGLSVLDLNGFDVSIGSLAGVAGATVSLGAHTLTAGGNNASTTYAGLITGTGGLTKVGSGTLTLSGTSTYTGPTNINAGVLVGGALNSLSSLSAFVIANAASLNISSADQTIGSLAGAGGATVNLGTHILTTGGNNTSTTYAGLITGSGGLTKVGLGTLTLSGTSIYSGATNINAGVLAGGAPNSLSQFSAFAIANAAVLDISAADQTIGSLAGVAGATVSLGAHTLTAGGNNASTTYAGLITGTGGLTKVGSGTLTLSGTSTYTGPTNINAGVLVGGALNSLSSLSAFVIANAASLDISSADQTIGSLAGAGGTTVNLGTHILTTGGNNTSTTYAGLITGSGGLTKVGLGTLTLSGTSIYSGATNINAGVLAGGASNSLSQFSAFAIANAAILDISAADQTIGSLAGVAGATVNLGAHTLTTGGDNTSTLLAGTISGSGGGALVKIGSGIFIIAGTNTYSAGTTISAGTLQIGSGGTSGSIVGNVIDNGNLTFNRSDSITFGGVISGTGALVQLGSGTLVLTADNTYGGGTTIDPGATLQLGNGGTTGSITGNVTDNGSLLFNRSNSVTFNSLIRGSGNLVQNGSGTTVLGGANTYLGGTIIKNGTLLVNNSQALGLGNVVVNGGVLGADPQPINVKGNYTQNAGGTLQLQVAGANPSQYDTLNVGGNATLGGTLQLISLGFQPNAGNQLTLVTSGGTVSGQFARFVDPFSVRPGLNTIDLVYGKQSVVLRFLNQTVPTSPSVVPPIVIATIDFASFALTPNQLAAANLLDAVQLDPRAANLISFLDKEPFANLPGDFNKISPEGLTAFYEISFSNANIQKLNLEGRLDDIRNGSTGFNSNMKVNGATVNSGEKASADGKTSKASVEPILQPGPENRWGVWVTGFGDFVNVDGDGNANGYDFTTGGVSLGIDYRITDHLAIGAMGEYAHTWTSLKPSGDIDVDSGRGGLYATWFNHGIYLNGAIYGGHNTYESSRSSLGGLATGGTEGAEWSTFVSGGYDFHFGQLTVGPIASLQYTYVNVDGFSEKSSLAPLAIHSGSAESLRSDFGFRAFYQWQIGKILVEPSLKAAWEHEYKYSALPITAGFVGIPGPSATFFGPNEGHDSAIVSAGVSVQLTPAISTYVNYDGQLGRGNYDSNAVTGGFRISF